jgi:hypothetical protein
MFPGVGQIFVEVHRVMYHTKYLSLSLYSIIEEDIFAIRKTNDPMGRGKFWHKSYNLNKLIRGQLNNISCKKNKL